MRVEGWYGREVICDLCHIVWTFEVCFEVVAAPLIRDGLRGWCGCEGVVGVRGGGVGGRRGCVCEVVVWMRGGGDKVMGCQAR